MTTDHPTPAPDDFDIKGFVRPLHGHPGHWEEGHAHPGGGEPHTHVTPTPAPMDGERVEELDVTDVLDTLRQNADSYDYLLDDISKHIVPPSERLRLAADTIESLAASLSEAEARAERAETKLRNRERSLEAAYEEKNGLRKQLEAERSRSSRVIEAAQKVSDSTFDDGESIFVDDVAIGELREALGERGLAAALQDTPADTEPATPTPNTGASPGEDAH